MHGQRIGEMEPAMILRTDQQIQEILIHAAREPDSETGS
jgi:hypothetical protein